MAYYALKRAYSAFDDVIPEGTRVRMIGRSETAQFDWASVQAGDTQLYVADSHLEPIELSGEQIESTLAEHGIAGAEIRWSAEDRSWLIVCNGIRCLVSTVNEVQFWAQRLREQS